MYDLQQMMNLLLLCTLKFISVSNANYENQNSPNNFLERENITILSDLLKDYICCLPSDKSPEILRALKCCNNGVVQITVKYNCAKIDSLDGSETCFGCCFRLQAEEAELAENK